jgi:RsiW-degrading membrane proteinase PrsW (M82 family)
VFFFFCGIIMSISMTFFITALLLPSLSGLGAFLAQVIGIAVFPGFIEEFSKIFPLYYRHGETQRSILILALAVGLGFGLVELIEYVFLFNISIFARLPGLFFHPATTMISAYGIATKKPIPFYFLAFVLHFGANFLALTNPFPFSPSILVIGLAVYLAYRFYTRSQEKMIAWQEFE